MESTKSSITSNGTPSMVRVVSPATLTGRSTFEAEVDGKRFIVTVPDEGIGKGDDFEVPYPQEVAPVTTAMATTADAAVPVTAASAVAVAFEVPTGAWRKGLCDCFDACCCPFMMGWCCFPILMGQVMERLNLDFFGRLRTGGSGSGSPPPICVTYSAVTISLFVVGNIITMATGRNGLILIYIIWVIWALYMLVVFTFARMNMRKKYNIEPICCCGDNCMDDCCSVYFCGCCTAIQMANHTHDPDKYQYNCTSRNGLNSFDPQIV